MLTNTSRKILDEFQVRKSKKQKAAFRDWLGGELRTMGYEPREESGFAARNLVVGDPERAEVLLTAHYDTCAVMPVPNFITPRSLFWYGLYQLLLTAAIILAGAAAEVLVIVVFDPSLVVAILSLYAVVVFCFWWLLDGPANKHTVNDNTSGVLTLVELAASMPEHLRDKVCFVFFDNEEKGLFGSAAFAKAHKNVKKHTLVLNFDCVSDGNSIQFFPSKALKKDAAFVERLAAAFPAEGEKTAQVVTGFGFYPSDQKNFVNGVGVCALKKSRIFGYYMDRIHTKRDTVLEEENIRLLRDGVIRFLNAEQ